VAVAAAAPVPRVAGSIGFDHFKRIASWIKCPIGAGAG
jgi:hypothetical protein